MGYKNCLVITDLHIGVMSATQNYTAHLKPKELWYFPSSDKDEWTSISTDTWPQADFLTNL